MVKYNIGSLLVSLENEVMGIITERDILRTIATQPDSLSGLYVGDYMTHNPITGSPDDDVSDVMGLMTSHRVRHLPILDENRLAGMISIGDIVKAQHKSLVEENHYLKVYIQS
jgi:CBS domain-containing protein